MNSIPRARIAASSAARSSRCLLQQTRSFSSTQRRCNTRMPRINIAGMSQPQKSMQSRLKKAGSKDLPSDIGILPSTFVKPLWSEMSPSSKNWRGALRFQWLFIKQTVRDTLAMAYLYKWGARKERTNSTKRSFPLWKRERIEVARQLHQTLYTAIAKGDKSTINKIALSGLAQQQASRIERRRMVELPNESWSVKYIGGTPPKWLPWLFQPLWPRKAIKIVADRQVNLPFGDALSCRQFVARIHSLQVRDKKDGTPPVQRTMTEYFVVQRMIHNFEEQEWKVWGTTGPSTDKDLEEIESLNKSSSGDQSFMDRVREKLPSSFGNTV